MGCGGGKATQASAPRRVQNSSKDLTGKAKSSPSGSFQSALPPSNEGRRDFTRIFFANERKIFFVARGMPSMRALQPTTGPSSAHIGDLSEQVVERARNLFIDVFTAQLTQVQGTAPDPSWVESLCSKAMLAMTVNVGLDFALHMEMLPTFLQPFFLVIMLGEPLQARIATYGFIAERVDQIIGDRPESKRTPICVRLLSPDLLGEAAARDSSRRDLLSSEADGRPWEVGYSIRQVSAASIKQAVEADFDSVRAAANSGSWQPLS